MPVSEQTFLQLIKEDPEGKWELHCGRLWSKEPMTWQHSDAYGYVGFLLQGQLSRDDYIVKRALGSLVHLNGARAAILRPGHGQSCRGHFLGAIATAREAGIRLPTPPTAS